ncbi:MAG: hypothetical protein ACI8WB_002423 [Phenylobacterium sp.]|jgi:hypothetical protein
MIFSTPALTTPPRQIQLRLIVAVLIRFMALLMALLPATLLAGEPLQPSDNIKRYPLGLHLQLLEDPTTQWTVQEVLSAAKAKTFRPSNQEVPNFASSQSAWWAKFSIKNPSNLSQQWILELAHPTMDIVEVYFLPFEAVDTNRAVITGESLPFASRAVDHPNFVFPFTLASQQTQTVLLKIRNSDTAILPLTLWDPQAFIEHTTHKAMGFGLYYGIMLVMVLYNFFLFISTRDKNFLYYVLYIFFFSLTMFSLNGLSYQYLWPESPYWASHSPTFLGSISIASGLLFTHHFLRLSTYHPGLNRLFIITESIIALLGVGFLVMPQGVAAMLSVITLIIAIPMMISINCGKY